ncbi:MTAP family purine nucleoside phosphorylase [bacterium]|nr:MTAP family purine nucleoside phosphorylase [bacterium]
MLKLGIIGGSSVLDLDQLKDFSKKITENTFGKVEILKKNNVFFLQRHGLKYNIPPHKINHRANIRALFENGVNKIIGISSVGSLKRSILPGTFVIPDDYINIWNISTFFDDSCVHTVPGLDDETRCEIFNILNGLGIEHRETGIYLQTRGPRFETPAEVKMLSQFADIISMTAASEATLARELDIPYALICSVDNYANGVIDKPLEVEQIKENVQKNKQNLYKIISGIVEFYSDGR